MRKEFLNVDVDDGSELRPKMLEKLLKGMEMIKNIPALEGKSLGEALGTEESRRQLILHLNPEDYRQLITGINGLLRNQDRDAWVIDKGPVYMGNPEYPIWEFPNYEDKVELIDNSLKAAQKMVKENRDIKDVGLLLSSSITATHLFPDGNGRTGKFILAVVNKGYNKNSTGVYERLLSSPAKNHGNLTNVDLMGAYISKLLRREIGLKNEARLITTIANSLWDIRSAIKSPQMNFNTNTFPQKQEEFRKRISQNPLMREAILLYAQRDLEKYEDEDGDVVLETVISDLNNQTIDEIITMGNSLKRRWAEIIIDVIANPNKPDYQFPVSDNDTKSLLDIYKEEIKLFTDEKIYKEIFE